MPYNPIQAPDVSGSRLSASASTNAATVSASSVSVHSCFVSGEIWWMVESMSAKMEECLMSSAGSIWKRSLSQATRVKVRVTGIVRVGSDLRQ